MKFCSLIRNGEGCLSELLELQLITKMSLEQIDEKYVAVQQAFVWPEVTSFLPDSVKFIFRKGPMQPLHPGFLTEAKADVLVKDRKKRLGVKRKGFEIRTEHVFWRP